MVYEKDAYEIFILQSSNSIEILQDRNIKTIS